jgi:hypothetical protein
MYVTKPKHFKSLRPVITYRAISYHPVLGVVLTLDFVISHF